MTLDLPGGGTWTVNNSEGDGGGTMDLTSATWHSVNVVFAQLDLDVGPEERDRDGAGNGDRSRRWNRCRRRGSAASRYGVTPLEMADAYATLANGGIHHDPTAISKVEFPDGKVDEFGADDGERVLTPGEAYEVTRILEGVITSGTGAGYTSIGCSAEAGKTGTSEEESDAWFVGYTPLFSTAVWVGHPTDARIHRLRRPHRRPDLAELHVGRAGRRMPGIRSARRPARALRPRQRTHLRSGYSDSLRRRRNLRRRRRTRSGEKDEGEERGGAKKATPNRSPKPTPKPTPDPARRPPAPALGRRRHQPGLAPTALRAWASSADGGRGGGP